MERVLPKKGRHGPSTPERPEGEATPLYRLLKLFGTPLLKVFFRLKVVGTENVPRSGPFILAANHVSYLDPLVLAAACPRPVHFIMLKEFYEKSLIGWVCRQAGSFPVDQEGPATVALRRALGVLHQGRVLGIFPEGGRSGKGRLLPAKGGVALLVLKGGFPLVPAAIIGTDKAMPRGRAIPLPLPVSVRFGPPLTFTPSPALARREQIEKVTAETMLAIASLAQDARRG